MKIIYGLLITVLCVYSCGSGGTAGGSSLDGGTRFPDTLPLFRLALPDKNNSGILYLSEIADSVSYLLLNKQTKTIRNIYSTNDHILISGTGPICLFDTSGNFKRYVGGIGRGPEEYIQYRWIANPVTNNIYVYSAGSKMLKVFDAGGKFSHRIKNSAFENIDKIFYSGKNLVFSYPIEPGEGSSRRKELCLYNPVTNEIVDSLPDYYGLNSTKGRYGRYVYPISVTDIYNDQAFYMSKYGDTLYRISEERIEPYIAFNFGEYKYSVQSIKTGTESAQLSKNKIYPSGLLVFKDAVYLQMFYTNEGEFSGTGFSFICKIDLAGGDVSYYKTRITNNLDNGPDYSIPLSYQQDFSPVDIAAVKAMPDHYSYGWIVPQNKCEKMLKNTDRFTNIFNEADVNSPVVLMKVYRK